MFSRSVAVGVADVVAGLERASGAAAASPVARQVVEVDEPGVAAVAEDVADRLDAARA